MKGLTPFDQVHVVALDQPDVVLPLRTQPVPGFDGIAVILRQILQPINDERAGNALAGTALAVAGLVERCGDFDDLFDFPLHDPATRRG